MEHLKNPFDLPGKWYKANLHTHTTASDGKASPPERIAQYRAAGYDVLALTDHRVTHDVAGLSDRSMLIIGGQEYHPTCPGGGIPFHLVALHVPHGLHFTEKESTSANRCIAKVHRAGGLTVLAHPFWCGQGYENFKHLKGLSAIEVYNTTCGWAGRPCSENEWAHALDDGMILPAVGVDDAHSKDGGDLFGGWTWLKMPSLKVSNVLQAVRTGACYASTGPKIHDFGVRDGKVRLRCSPAAAIHFVSGPARGACRRAEEGKALRTFSIDPPKWPYVRGLVIDPAGRRAWTNPIKL
jgi:hypothetical protein